MIPVFEPVISEEDIEAVVAALRRGEISGSFGETIPSFERAFADFVGVRHGVAVSSGTTALHIAVAALDLPRGSEILMSASTNVATALAAHHNGCIPVPIDSEADTWNLDLDLLEETIDERTRAVIAVHLYGHPIDMDRLLEIARKHDLAVIEDCAESHGATCRGRMTGSFGEMGCFSFYANKVITTGEGGMVTTDDDDLATRLRLLRNLAFSEPRFVHELPGFNFRVTGMQAALGLTQLARVEKTVEAKRRVAHLYNDALRDIPGLTLPPEQPWARNVYWMYAVVVGPEFGVTRDALMSKLKDAGIDSRTFFCPVNLQPFLRGVDRATRPCPVAEELWRTGLYLPSSASLDTVTIDRIAATVTAVASGKA